MAGNNLGLEIFRHAFRLHLKALYNIVLKLHKAISVGIIQYYIVLT